MNWLEALQTGKKIKRVSWNIKGAYVVLVNDKVLDQNKNIYIVYAHDQEAEWELYKEPFEVKEDCKHYSLTFDNGSVSCRGGVFTSCLNCRDYEKKKKMVRYYGFVEATGNTVVFTEEKKGNKLYKPIMTGSESEQIYIELEE